MRPSVGAPLVARPLVFSEGVLLSRLYAYVGPTHILERVAGAPPGRAVRSPSDLARAALELGAARGEPLVVTYTVDAAGVLHVADRHSEHVACAGFRPVRGAGELTVEVDGAEAVVLRATNQSTGFCLEGTCWEAVQDALIAAGLDPPDGFDPVFVFRRCTGCRAINIVKDAWFVCGCGADLPERWNFDAL